MNDIKPNQFINKYENYSKQNKTNNKSNVHTVFTVLTPLYKEFYLKKNLNFSKNYFLIY